TVQALLPTACPPATEAGTGMSGGLSSIICPCLLAPTRTLHTTVNHCAVRYPLVVLLLARYWLRPTLWRASGLGSSPASNLTRARPATHRRVDGFYPRQTGCCCVVEAVSNDAGATTNDGGPLTGPAGNGGHEPATA